MTLTSRSPSISIRRRLLATLLSVVAFSWLITALVVYFDSRHEIEELFDAQLAQSARVLLAMSEHELAEQQIYQSMLGGDGFTQSVEISYEGATGIGHEYEDKLAFQVWTSDNHLALHSANAPTHQPLSSQTAGFSNQFIENGVWRVFSLTGDPSGIRILVGQSLEIRNELIGAISNRLLTPVLLSLPALALLIWYGITHAMRPLLRLAKNVRNLEPGQLKPLPLKDIPDESRPLVESLNLLFKQLQYAFDNERRFTADAAHELRTPLAALKVQAQVALGATDGEARRHALQYIIHGVDRATHLVEQLLTLARLDPENALQDTAPLKLTDICQETLAELANAAQKKHIQLALEAACDGQIMGNQNALYIMLRNLIDNAIRYTPEKGSVCVKIDCDENTTHLRISDSGPGIPAEEHTKVMERFYRGKAALAPGSGLGMSIVQRIVERHDASLKLSKSARDGLEVSIRFSPSPNRRI